MTGVILHHVDERDLGSLRELSIRTFEETFTGTAAPADMDLYLSESFNLERLASEWQTAGSEFYFALVDGEYFAGYLKINSGAAQTEFRDTSGFEVERLYVLREYQGRGVGTFLFQEAIRMATKAGASCLWLGVYEKNYRAIRFYEHFGMKPFGSHIFKVGTDPQVDILMKLDLE